MKKIKTRLDIYKEKARRKVYLEIRSGRMKSNPCYCGKEKVEAHHDNYSKPLEIIWLCKTHHMDKHYPNRHKIKLHTVKPKKIRMKQPVLYRLGVRFNKSQHKKIKKLAKMADVSEAEIVRRAVEIFY